MFSWFRKKPQVVEEIRYRVLDSDLYPVAHTASLAGTFGSKLEARNAVRNAGYDVRDYLIAPVACRMTPKETARV